MQERIKEINTVPKKEHKKDITEKENKKWKECKTKDTEENKEHK